MPSRKMLRDCLKTLSLDSRFRGNDGRGLYRLLNTTQGRFQTAFQAAQHPSV